MGRQPNTTRRSRRFIVRCRRSSPSAITTTANTTTTGSATIPAPGARHLVAHRERVQLLLVDSLIPGRAGGHIDDDDLDWLEDQLHARRRTRYPGAGRIPSSAGDRAHVVHGHDSADRRGATRRTRRPLPEYRRVPVRPHPFRRRHHFRGSPCASPPVSPPPQPAVRGIRCSQRGSATGHRVPPDRRRQPHRHPTSAPVMD